VSAGLAYSLYRLQFCPSLCRTSVSEVAVCDLSAIQVLYAFLPLGCFALAGFDLCCRQVVWWVENVAALGLIGRTDFVTPSLPFTGTFSPNSAEVRHHAVVSPSHFCHSFFPRSMQIWGVFMGEGGLCLC